MHAHHNSGISSFKYGQQQLKETKISQGVILLFTTCRKSVTKLTLSSTSGCVSLLKSCRV